MHAYNIYVCKITKIYTAHKTYFVVQAWIHEVEKSGPEYYTNNIVLNSGMSSKADPSKIPVALHETSCLFSFITLQYF